MQPRTLAFALHQQVKRLTRATATTLNITMTGTQADTPTEFPLLSLLSNKAKERNILRFWDDVPKVQNPASDIIPLVGGLPNHGFFPVTHVEVNLRSTPFEAADASKIVKINDVAASKASDALDIKNAFQYADQNGHANLREHIKQFVKRVVKPVRDDWTVACTLGGSDGIKKCFDIFLDAGDTILFEEFTFIPVLNDLYDRGAIPVPVKLSKIISDHSFEYYEELKDLLENWSTLKPGLPKPKVLYTIPNGHNPLGLAQTLDHKKKIYELAETHNFIIMEDEPYAYLNFDKHDNPNTKYDLTNDEFIDSLKPSYLTLDTSGRVVRIETFSKIYAPGLRLGFMVFNQNFYKYFSDSAELISRSPSGLSQLFVNNTIVELGGIEGWIHWITQVRNEYLRRKNIYVKSLLQTEAADKGYLSPIEPDCGMFVSLVINAEKHKDFNGENYNELMDRFYIKCVENGVVVVLGRNMSVDKTFSVARSTFIRTAVSFLDDRETFKEVSVRLNKAALALFET